MTMRHVPTLLATPRSSLLLLRTTWRRSSRAFSTTTAAVSEPGTGTRRFRQHVNPLAQQYKAPIDVPHWPSVFADPALPIHLDIGCARGKYLMQVAHAHARTRNYVGVEIRQNVVHEAQREAAHRALTNLAFVHANMNFQQQLLLPALPQAVESVSIFHPDPWMKKRHVKRRLVTDTFVAELADLLAPGTPVYVQTDVEELFAYMTDVFAHSQRFAMHTLDTNPLGIPTDREQFVRAQGGAIYRVQFTVARPTL